MAYQGGPQVSAFHVWCFRVDDKIMDDRKDPRGRAEPDADLSLLVEEGDRGRRIDFFLGMHHPDLSRSHYGRLVREGRVTVNGHAVKPSYEVKPGDRVVVRWPERADREGLTPEPMALTILYEDEHILVVDKPPGLVVHPGAGRADGTLVHGLLAHCSRLALQGAPLRPGIVHRLDQDTSGVLVVAKSERAYLELVRQFKEREVEKSYLALVYGGMGATKGEIRTLMGRHPVDRKRMAVLEGRGREAVSLWEVERAWNEVSLLRVAIRTGRTHQIRVHLSHLGHPVVGDETYGGGKRRAKALRCAETRNLLLSSASRQMLHAWKLTLTHPGGNGRMTFTASPPGDFAFLLQELDRESPPGS